MSDELVTSRQLIGKLTKGQFSRVKVVRELLKDRANEIVNAYLQLATAAEEAGNFEVAEKILWNLIEHMPNEGGERLIDPSASKPKIVEAPAQPKIQIGIALGGTNKKALPPAEIIDADE